MGLLGDKKPEYSYILFDLDGTLTDSGPGIMNGYEYALGKMDVEIPDRAFLKRFVGPPLVVSWRETLGFSEEDTQRGIAYYKEYYADKGVYENEVYPGIKELLSDLKNSGKKLYIATTKAEPMAKVVVEHFGLAEYFSGIAASNNVDRFNKIDVLKYILENCGVEDTTKAVMVRPLIFSFAQSLGYIKLLYINCIKESFPPGNSAFTSGSGNFSFCARPTAVSKHSKIVITFLLIVVRF